MNQKEKVLPRTRITEGLLLLTLKFLKNSNIKNKNDMSTQKIYTKIILKFFEDNPAISAVAIEREAQVTPRTVAQAKIKKVIPEPAIFPLLYVLARYGIKDKHGNRLFPTKNFCITARNYGNIRTISIDDYARTVQDVETKIYCRYEDL